LEQQCAAAKGAGSSSAAAACEAASSLSRLATLSRECRAAKAPEANGQSVDMSAYAEANILVGC
jgi:hypothetical protein